ncbi:MAG: DUF47 family protein [Thiohalocapsa sp.]|jgi:uncharacterized protein Yka (UPF0111/DUF47 family)|nr:DUF47 family protein [Thiohalocapsa sp.]MCF7989333.1 DUF47 family protein [Thiohalocapsa sp.]
MSTQSTSAVTRLVDRVFPRMPDFYGLINAQCELVCEAMDVFVAFMQTGDVAKGEQVRGMEKAGDELKAKNMEVLSRAFATPMDREDIYRAIVTIDEILNYAKTTVREVEALNIKPDAYMADMAALLRDGSNALREGYAKLSSHPAAADTDAAAARKAERNTEKVYRAALAELFDAEEHIAALGKDADNAQTEAMRYVIEIFKRREVYRHLSNAADRMEHAGGVLHDIVVQIA